MLDSNGNDLSWNGNTGTLVNAPTKVRRLQNDGLTYNGTTQYQNIPLTGTTAVTISLWAKKVSGSNFVLIRKDTVWTRHLYWMSNGTGDELKLGVYNWTFYEVTSSLAPAEWFVHFAMTVSWSSWTCIAYKNGVSVGSISVWAFTAPSSDVYIARDVTGSAGFFNWTVINPMIWNRALSATEIQLLHKATFIK